MTEKTNSRDNTYPTIQETIMADAGLPCDLPPHLRDLHTLVPRLLARYCHRLVVLRCCLVPCTLGHDSNIDVRRRFYPKVAVHDNLRDDGMAGRLTGAVASANDGGMGTGAVRCGRARIHGGAPCFITA